MAKPLSEQLADLSTRVRQAEDSVSATKAQNTEMIRKREDEIVTAAMQRKERMREQVSGAREDLTSTWSGLTNKMQSDFDGIRAKIDVKKYEHDRKKAVDAAHDAEENAVMAIDFAMHAVDYAETAALDAVLARETAASY